MRTNLNQQILILFWQMAYHRIKLTDGQPGNNSFSHQQSISQAQSKHKKKGSLYLKHDRNGNYNRLKTDEKQPSSILNQQPLKSHAASIHMGHSTNSATKLSRAKRTIVYGQNKKKKSKHTISVINLGKNIDDSKHKSSSNITKRKQSAGDFSEKIKSKIEDFKIIANCLEEYTKEERKNNQEVNLKEILKIIAAFNRSQIAPISKPLEKLINEIMNSIHASLPQIKLKSNLKRSISFESPQKQKDAISKEVKDTVKKTQGSRDYLLKKEEYPGEVNTLEENLGRLKYESNRLKYFLEEIASNREDEKKVDRSGLTKEKIDELQQLRSIAQEQAKIIRELDNSSDQCTFREESSN